MVNVRRIVIVRTVLFFSLSGHNNDLSTFTFYYTQVMMKSTLQSHVFKGFFTIFWVEWICKLFSYLCLVYVVVVIMQRIFCTQLATIKAGMPLVLCFSSVVTLLCAGNNFKTTKGRKWEKCISSACNWAWSLLGLFIPLADGIMAGWLKVLW